MLKCCGNKSNCAGEIYQLLWSPSVFSVFTASRWPIKRTSIPPKKQPEVGTNDPRFMSIILPQQYKPESPEHNATLHFYRKQLAQM